MPRARHRLAVVAGLGVLVAAAGCSSSAGGSAGGPVSGVVTIAAVPGIDNVPLYLASHDGLFSTAGVTVQIRPYSSVTAEVQALSSGRVDMAAGDYGSFLYADSRAKSPDIKIISDGYDATSGVLEVLTLPNSGITSPEQLAGKQIAAPDTAALPTPAGTPDSLATAATTSVLRSYGVDMATVSWDPMAESAEITALRDHRVQAILVTEPYIYQAESQLGALEVVDACSGATQGLPLSGYFALGSWAAAHKDAVEDFQSALGQAQSQAATAGPVQSALPRYTGMTSLEAEVVTVGTYPDSTSSNDLQRVAELMSDEGILRNPVAVASLIVQPPRS
jgi:NitT/TauT family transport system substrate-binding protein